MSRRGPRPVHDRLRRLLVMLPWLMERGEAPISEIAERFGLAEAEVIADLEQVACCGLPPFIDEFVDLFIDDGVAYVGIPRFFTRPLRLTAPEAFTVLAAARAALALPGADPDGALARAVARLGAVLGDDGIAPELDTPPYTDVLLAATEAGERVAIEYWSPSAGTTTRTIDPQQVFTDRGLWYVVAHDDLSGEQRTFRIDRMLVCEPTGETGARAATPTDAVMGGPVDWAGRFPDGERVRLELRAGVRWIADQLPVEVVADDGETLVVDVVVADESWLRTMLLQIGAQGRVLEPAGRRGLGAALAAEVLAMRYSDR